jgi:hypothetical protein
VIIRSISHKRPAGIGGDKKLLDLLAYLLGQIARVFVCLLAVRFARDGNQPVHCGNEEAILLDCRGEDLNWTKN